LSLPLALLTLGEKPAFPPLSIAFDFQHHAVDREMGSLLHDQ